MAPSILTRADAERALPRLGGMARPDGVVIVSDRFWALARPDGTVREGVMPAAPAPVRHVPLLRGLARLATALAPLARSGGVAGKRERAFLLVAVLAPCGLAFLPERVGLAAGLLLGAALVAWMLRGRTLSLHGAEHRAIAAVEERRLVATWTGAAHPSRFALRCGTNFAALALPVAAVADRLWPLPLTLWSPLAVAVLSLAVTMEVWQVVQTSSHPVARAFMAPGLALQRLTTREPTLEETQVALRAVASVLRRELDPV